MATIDGGVSSRAKTSSDAAPIVPPPPPPPPPAPAAPTVDRTTSTFTAPSSAPVALQTPSTAAATPGGPTVSAAEIARSPSSAVTAQAAAGSDTPAGQKTAADGAADAAAITQLAQDNPQAAASQLASRLAEEQNAEYRQALVDGVTPVLPTLAGAVGAKSATRSGRADKADLEAQNAALGEAADLTDPDTRSQMAAAYVRSNPNGNGTQTDFDGAIRNGHGASFAIEVAKQYQAAGRNDLATQVMETTSNAVLALQADFRGASNEVNTLNQQLVAEIGALGPGLSDAQIQAAVNAFHERHKGAYEEVETAAKKYANAAGAYAQLATDPAFASSPTIRARAASIAEDVPSLGETKVGQEWLADQVEKQGEGKPCLLIALAGMGKDLKSDFNDRLSQALTKSVGLRAMEYAAAGKLDQAGTLFAGLEKNAAVYGLAEKDMKELVETWQSLRPGMSQGEVEAISAKMNKVLNGAGSGTPGADPNSHAGQALRGLSLAFSTIYLAGEFNDFPDASLRDRVKTVGDYIQATGDAASLMSGIAGTAAEEVAKFAEKTNAFGLAIGAACDGVATIQAVREGNWGEATADGLSSVGSALIAASALVEGFPGAGQIAGAAMIAGGIAVKYISGAWDQHQADVEKRALLQAAGLDGDTLEAYCKADPNRIAELGGMGYSAQQIQTVAGRYPTLITDGENKGISLRNFHVLEQGYGLSADQSYGMMLAVGAGTDDPASAMASFLRAINDGSFDNVTTPQQWAQALAAKGDVPDSPGSHDYRTAFQNAQTYLANLGSPSGDH